MERVGPPRGRVRVPAVVQLLWLLVREAFRVAMVLATSFVFFTYLLYLGTTWSGHVDLRTDARLQGILSEHAHGLFTASKSLRNLRPSKPQQPQYQGVGDPHLFEPLADLTSQICTKLVTADAILGQGLDPANATE